MTSEHQLCILCGLIWNRGRDTCPPHLRSEEEDRMVAALRRKERAA